MPVGARWDLSARVARLACGDVAQSVEHLLCKQGVGGSSPLVSTGKGLVDGLLHPSPLTAVDTQVTVG